MLVASIGIVSADNLSENTANPGNFVWDENTASSNTYTWDARTFSGFYYDLDSGKYSESMTINMDSCCDRIIEEGDLEYSTVPIDADFKHGDWGSYKVIGFIGEKYFAGYTSDTKFPSDKVSPISDGVLTKVLLDDNRTVSFNSSSPLVLEDGYKLNLVEIDTNGKRALITLEKGGERLDTGIVESGDDYVYQMELGNNDVPIIAVHFSNITHGYETNPVSIDGIFQITDEYLLLEAGDSYSEMELIYYSDSGIGMKNEDPINLSKGNVIQLMGNVSFKVADDDNLRFAPFVNKETGNIYYLRGTVAENDTFTWTPLNFEGFYYDINNNIGYENLEIISMDDRLIEEGNLEYTSTIQELDFKANYSDLDPAEFPAKYPVMGLFGEMYVPLRSDTPDKLTKLLIDSDEEYILTAEETVEIGIDYTISLDEITGNKMLLSLFKDGENIDTQILAMEDRGATLVYQDDLLSEDDIDILKIHFNNISQNQTIIDGVWLRDEDNPVTIKVGDSFGKLTVSEIGSNYLKMENTENVTLFQNSVIEIVEDCAFQVADDDEVRFYPFMQTTTPSIEFRILNPGREQLESESGTPQDLVVTASKVCDFTWLVNDIEIQTNDSCMRSDFSYTPTSAGSYIVTVQAENSDEKIVQSWNMSINPVSNTVDTPSSSSSSSSSSGGGGGGGGSTGEAYENILKKEVVRENVNKDMETTYSFKEEVNPVESVKFVALKNAGPISATIEVLKGKSTFVDVEPSGEVYQNINVWIGKTGFATPANIKDAQVQFKVEKAWIEENNIQDSSICLCRYNENAWDELTTQKVDEDDKYIYFISETSGFSAFAITGNALENTGKTDASYSLQDNIEKDPATSEADNSSSAEQKSTPGLGITASITVYALVALVLRRRN